MIGWIEEALGKSNFAYEPPCPYIDKGRKLEGPFKVASVRVDGKIQSAVLVTDARGRFWMWAAWAKFDEDQDLQEEIRSALAED